MSVRTMARVWAESQRAGSELLMLLAIADFADDDGYAYPAVGTLAVKCRMGERNASYVLAALQECGELEVQKNMGPRGSNVYRILMQGVQSVAGGVQRSAPPTPATDCRGGVQQVAGEGCNPLREGVQPIAPKPSGTIIEPPVNHQKRERALTRTPVDDLADLLVDVDPQVVADFRALRKAKRSVLTRTALQGIAREAAKAGMSLEAVLSLCCTRSWQGFEARWVQEQQGLTGFGSSGSDKRAARMAEAVPSLTSRRQTQADKLAAVSDALTGRNRERTDHANRSPGSAIDVDSRVVTD